MTDDHLESQPEQSARVLDDSAKRTSARTRWLAAIALVCYLAVLFVHGVIHRPPESAADASVFQLDYLLRPLDWIVLAVTRGLVEFVKLAAAGFWVPLAMGRPTGGGLLRRLARLTLFLSAGVGLSLLVLGIESGRLAAPLFLVLPMGGFLLGTWFGSAMLRGYWALLWLIPKLALLLLLVVAAAGGLVFLAFDDAALPFEPPTITSAEKRRVAVALRSSRTVGDETKKLCLSDKDVDSLLTLAFAHSPLDGKARVVFEEGTVSTDVSIKTPLDWSPFQYVNLSGSGQLEVVAGRLQVRPERLQIGRVTIPKHLLALSLSALVSELLRDPDLTTVLESIDSARFKPGIVEGVYRSGVFSNDVVPSLLARLGQKPDVVSATQVYYRHLVKEAEGLPKGDERFGAFLEAAFRLARERSARQDKDPALENRAAILALAVLLGHHRVEDLVGTVSTSDLQRTARRAVGRVPLRRRADWTKHFWVSAALALVSNGRISDGVGLFKEELDAEGGSGFSFSDLQADRAGTLFALNATRDERSARSVQDRLAAGFAVDDFFPPGADLPEGIPDAELQSDYGGVGGDRYNQVLAELESRLAACAGLK